MLTIAAAAADSNNLIIIIIIITRPFKQQTTTTCVYMAAQVKVHVCCLGLLPSRLNGGPICDENATEVSCEMTMCGYDADGSGTPAGR